MDTLVKRLEEAISRDDARTAVAILNKERDSLLNKPYLNLLYTPLGYAAWMNQKACVEAIASIPGVDLSYAGGGHGNKTPMAMALGARNVEAAKILARKGADCTEKEKKFLGNVYTNFQLIIQQTSAEQLPAIQNSKVEEIKNKEVDKGRELVRHWMDTQDYPKLRQWLSKFKRQLEGRWEAGGLPVVGWLELEATMQCKGASKRSLQAELEESTRECNQLAKQIQSLEQKRNKLAKRKKQLEEQLKKIEEIATLEAESQSIDLLARKEEEALVKLKKKMENPYFMEDLNLEDVSTVFSLFNMDSLFARYKQKDIYNNLEVTANATVENLQRDLELSFSEAVELIWKLKLFENREEGVARHLGKCAICSAKKPGSLLQEYGMNAEDRKQIEGKMEGWNGFYFATVNAASAGSALDLAPALTAKLTTCWMRIQKAHKWQHPDD